MIAQLMFTAFLLGILLYALTEYRRSPAVGLTAVLAAVGGLYFVWVPSHAIRLAEFVGIGRGVDLIDVMSPRVAGVRPAGRLIQWPFHEQTSILSGDRSSALGLRAAGISKSAIS
jgi:hypothetical protein